MQPDFFTCCSVHKMAPIVLLFSFSLLHLCATQGTPVFVQTGKDLRLDVQKPVDLRRSNVLTWSVNDTINVVRLLYEFETAISEEYRSRAEYSAEDHSLLLKKVTKMDSGDYRAHVSGDRVTTVAEHSVTVLDPVSGVKLTVKSCSSDSTNVTVICSTEDSLINSTFTCDNQTCSHEGGERAEIITPGASLDVYLENGSVICNHSNQVSSTRNIQKIEDLCRKPEVSTSGRNNVTKIIVPIVCLIAVLALVVIGGLFYGHRRKQRKTTITVYEDPQDVNTDLHQEQRPTNDPSAVPPASIYSLLNAPNGSEASTQPRNNTEPESMYAMVEKPAKT